MAERLASGWHPRARRAPSPNHDEFPAGAKPELVVIHGISLPAGSFAIDEIERLFANQSTLAEVEGLRVSAHFLIDRDGALVQFVSCARRAWHAGRSSWRGRAGCNDFSLGIELVGADAVAYAPAQYAALAELLGDLFASYPSLAAVAGHCDVAPGRKSDPGESFAWDRLFAAIGARYDGRGER